MTKRNIILQLLVIVVIIALFYLFNRNKTTTVTINGHNIEAEIADTPIKQNRGLMKRKNMAQNKGMLFIFKESSRQIFWMKNTFIPLDMIWIDENKYIVDITKNAQPCTTQNCQLYMPSQPVNYVLEVNGGYTDKQNIKIGDKVSWEKSENNSIKK